MSRLALAVFAVLGLMTGGSAHATDVTPTPDDERAAREMIAFRDELRHAGDTRFLTDPGFYLADGYPDERFKIRVLSVLVGDGLDRRWTYLVHAQRLVDPDGLGGRLVSYWDPDTSELQLYVEVPPPPVPPPLCYAVVGWELCFPADGGPPIWRRP